MRISVKGGVWKNSEDEIIKAAVMKYGLTQWARVSSLLPRKTAAQVKARWYEWLDPRIKKTEWTRDEEERLLHLAKLMPAQWRTIAPLVGRTAAQCLEHYEKLLDAAAAAKDGVVLDPKDDPRRLRPGEIDPAPEVKPARPDPVDMDEDEKEMLSEARARLANTQGKKMKRRAREHLLEDARRLARLQKARELKAAGIDITKRKRRREDGMDYSAEIPYEKRAPAGFFDVSADDARLAAEKAAETVHFKMRLLSDVERGRASAVEAKARAQAKARQRKTAAEDLPSVMAAEAEKDPLNLRKRARLELPAPVLSEAELEAVVRLGSSTIAAMDLDGDAPGSVVTGALMNEYDVAGGSDVASAIASLAASRGGGGAAAAAASRSAILEEARNQAAMKSMLTPLLGGENVTLEAGTGFVGVTPATALRTVRADAGATPTPLTSAHSATPASRAPGLGLPPPRHSSNTARTAEDGDGASVAGDSVITHSHSVLNAPGLTRHARDALGINREDDALSAAGSELGPSPSIAGFSERSGVTRATSTRAHASNVALSLAGLPKPKHTYAVVTPELDPAVQRYAASTPHVDAGTSAYMPDAADLELARRQGAQAEQAAALLRRSRALQHEPPLPRPLVLDDDAIAPARHTLQDYLLSQLPSATPASVAAMATSESLVRDEMLHMLKADAVAYPVVHKAFRKPRHAIAMTAFSDTELADARAVLMDECVNMQLEHALPDLGAVTVAALQGEVASSHVQLPRSNASSSSAFVLSSSLSPAEHVSVHQAEHARLRDAFSCESARISKVEQRSAILTRGYETRARTQQDALTAAHTKAVDLEVELRCVVRLAHDEARALPRRVADAAALVQYTQAAEQALQTRYASLLREMEHMKGKLMAAGVNA